MTSNALTIPIEGREPDISARETMIRAKAPESGSLPIIKLRMSDIDMLNLAAVEAIFAEAVPAGVSRSVIFRKALATLLERLGDPEVDLRREAVSLLYYTR